MADSGVESLYAVSQTGSGDIDQNADRVTRTAITNVVSGSTVSSTSPA